MPRIPPIYLRDPPDNLSINIEDLQKFASVTHLMRHLKNEHIAREFLEAQRWNGRPYCPYCGATGAYRTDRGYKCRSIGCYQKFTVTVGTIYENTKALRFWFGVIYMVITATKPISSVKIAKKLGLTQKSTYFMLKKMRDMPKPKMKQKNPDAVALGKLGGAKGGAARAKTLSADRRSEIASKGAAARWSKKEIDNKKNKQTMNNGQPIDKDALFNESRRLYLTKQIGSDVLLKRLRDAGVTLALIPDHEGRWACAPTTWTNFAHDSKGSTMQMWIPEAFWQDSPRNAAVYTINRLYKERNKFLTEEEKKEEDE